MRVLCDAPYVVVMSLSALSLACLASLSQPDLQQQRDRPGREVHEFVALGGGEAGEGFSSRSIEARRMAVTASSPFSVSTAWKSLERQPPYAWRLPFVRLGPACLRLARFARPPYAAIGACPAIRRTIHAL